MRPEASLEVLRWTKIGGIIGSSLFLALAATVEGIFVWGNNEHDILPDYIYEHPFFCLLVAVAFGSIFGSFLGGNLKDTQLRWRASLDEVARQREQTGPE